MEGLGTEAPEVPDHVRVLQVSLWVSLLAMDEGWKLNGSGRRERENQSPKPKFIRIIIVSSVL